MTVSCVIDGILQAQDHYPLRQLAESICEGIRSKDYLSEILATHNFLCARTRYMRDPRTVELVRSPKLIADALIAGRTPNLDCDDESAIEGALHLMIGCEVRLVTVAFRNMFYRGERQYSHIFAQAKEPKSGAWITCDPVAGLETENMMRRVVAAKIWPVA